MHVHSWPGHPVASLVRPGFWSLTGQPVRCRLLELYRGPSQGIGSRSAMGRDGRNKGNLGCKVDLGQ